MAQQLPLEPDNPLYQFAKNDLDLTKVPEKLRCKGCGNFVLNAFKAACCDSGLCEECNNSHIDKQCPACKHTPLVTSASKALRATARNYLKSQMASAETAKSVEATPVAATNQPETKEPTVAENGSSGHEAVDDVPNGDSEKEGVNDEQSAQADEVLQSIEIPQQRSRRETMDSASGNEDDDIEINVGPDYDFADLPAKGNATADDEDQWQSEQQPSIEQSRKNSTIPANQQRGQTQNQGQNQNQQMTSDNSQSNGFSGFDATPGNISNMSSDQMQTMMQSMTMGMNMPNPQSMMMMNNMITQRLGALQAQYQQSWAPHLMSEIQQLVNMQNSMTSMQSMMGNFGGSMGSMMGMPNFNMAMGMNSGFMNSMNASNFNSGQQFNQNFPNGNYPFNARQNSFDRGRGRGKRQRGGRGSYAQMPYQNQYGNNFNNMPFQNNFNQMQNQFQQNHNQHDQMTHVAQHTNENKEIDQPNVDDDDFAPGGQDEVQEALGDSYRDTEEPTIDIQSQDIANVESKQETYQKEPSPVADDRTSVVDSPKPQYKEQDIPEAYREDLDTSVPPTAPSGPSSKDVPFRSRGHGRFPSRGQRGSYHGSSGYPPRSPARPVSSHLTVSPAVSIGPGIVGAPTGPRAMREKEAPITTKSLSRSESDVGFKIRGTASQVKDKRTREEEPKSATSRSTYEDYESRDREQSRRHSKYDRKHGSSRYDEEYEEETDTRDSGRRKSRRDERADEYEMDGVDYSQSASRSDSQDRGHRSGKRDKEKPRDKYSSSTKHKSSKKETDEYDNGDDYGEDSRSKSKKSSRTYDDYDDRDRRDHERAERDKHRKRSRHDRDREDNYEDADEEESRRKSRKHKKEHSSRKERDREPDSSKDTDLGMRITGRSSNRRESEVAAPQVDKDPHTLEREARNRERMLKEQQRREAANNAKSGGLSGGRTRSYKYEDDIERQLNKPSRRR